ncbi:MAG: DDE-type integrase/transposase/recombinase [Magnetococcales bacterium]|nr:DDE-type integrase/transposase/recombinase [Magnetococcales bacterium]
MRTWFQRNNIQGKERSGCGGGYEYPLSSLPEAAQVAVVEKYADTVTLADAEGLSDLAKVAVQRAIARRERPNLESLPEAVKSRIRRTSPGQKEIEEGLVAYKEAANYNREAADRRFAVIQAFRAYHKQIGGAVKTAIAAFCEAVNSGNEFLPEEARGVRFSPRTLLRWHVGMKSGVGGLLGKLGNRKDQFAITKAEFALVEAMIIQYPHVRAVVVEQAVQARFPGTETSYDTIRNVIRHWKLNNASFYLRITDPDKWRGQHMPAFGSRSEHLDSLNQLWEMDSTKADIILKDGRRYIIVGVIDVYSRRLKFLVSRSSSSAAVTALIRNAILDWGVPMVIKTDNGSDYIALNTVRVLESLKVEQWLCNPGNPQEKPHIERHFRTLNHGLLELLPGYIGHSVAERKGIEGRVKQWMHTGAQVDLPYLDADGLQRFLDDWTKIYLHRPHDGLDGRTPFDVAAKWPDPVRRIADERALDLLLNPLKGVRVVSKKGISVDGRTYIAAELGTMVGEEVEVRLDESDAGRIYVYGMDGAFACVAVDPAMQGVSRAEVATAASSLQRQATAVAKKYAKQAVKDAGAEGIHAEILAARAAAAPNVTILQPKGQHTTPALQEAGKAARATDPVKPAPQTEQETEARARLVARMQAQPEQEETREDRYHRAQRLERMLENGWATETADREWLERYQQSAEYRAMCRVEKLRVAMG